MFTVRYSEPSLPKELKNSKRFIVAHFHQDEIVLIKTRMRSGFFIMTSTSTDGEMMTRFLELLGYHCIRGSSTRGGSRALIEMIHILKRSKHNAVLAVDGPRGPIYKVKDGVLMLSKQTSFPILPVGIKVSSFFCINSSWNKLIIPKPFSRVDIKFGKIIEAPILDDKSSYGITRVKLEKELKTLKGL